MTSYIDDLAQALRDGAAADVWYDAQAHVTDSDDPGDPDVVASALIDGTQSAMGNAATELVTLRGLLARLDAAARVNGLWRTHGPLLTEVRQALARLDADVPPDPAPGAPSP